VLSVEHCWPSSKEQVSRMNQQKGGSSNPTNYPYIFPCSQFYCHSWQQMCCRSPLVLALCLPLFILLPARVATPLICCQGFTETEDRKILWCPRKASGLLATICSRLVFGKPRLDRFAEAPSLQHCQPFDEFFSFLLVN